MARRMVMDRQRAVKKSRSRKKKTPQDKKLEDLQKTLYLAFRCLMDKADGSITKAAKLSGLSTVTLRKIADCKYTLQIKQETIDAICKVSGFSIKFEDDKFYLVDEM